MGKGRAAAFRLSLQAALQQRARSCGVLHVAYGIVREKAVPE
jgi:hypothetical protein